jgi:hypothetical protein
MGQEVGITEYGWLGDSFAKRVYPIPSAASDIIALPVEYAHNPVLAPAVDRAYYPSVMYFPAGFTVGGTPYKYLVIHALDEDAGGGLCIAGSQDFKTWVQLNGGNPLIGLPSAAHHPHVTQIGPASFRIWYWDTSVSIYGVNAMRTAVSTDLINWTGDQPLQNGTNPIITGAPGFNTGTYGPCKVFYNSAASNVGTNPFNYTYAMFFDGTTGSYESIGLGYSADGITFNLYAEVLPAGAPTSGGNTARWDSNYTTFCDMFQTPLGKWLMFYSGGRAASSEGIGVAVSDDRLAWTKMETVAPLISMKAGTWRDNRAYAPSIVTDFVNRFNGAGDQSDMKMLVSGRDASGKYTLGYFNVPYIYADVKEALYRMERL